MMTREITFLHLTDLHIGDFASDPGLHSDTIATMGMVRRQIDEISPRPSFIAVSGDLTNRGDAASYRILREIMSDLSVPVFYALGNHDSRPAFYAEMLGRNHDLDAPYDHEAVIDGVHVVTIDSSAPGRIGGMLEDRQFAFVDAALSLHPYHPKLLVVHHPPALSDDPARQWESLSIADTHRLAEMIKGRGVAGILSGHIHLDRVAQWCGAPLIVNTGQHCALDIQPDTDEIRLFAGASFGRGVLRGGDLILHFVSLHTDQRELGRLSYSEISTRDAMAAKAAGRK
jgi:3',5'-cyclic AMP phosphodiesterase CpdA